MQDMRQKIKIESRQTILEKEILSPRFPQGRKATIR